MLTDAQYAQELGISLAELQALPEDVALFTQFDFDCGAMVNRDGTPMFPELKGEYTPLFEVQRVGKVFHNIEADELQRQFEAEKEKVRRANLEKYIGRGYAFEPPNGGDDD